MKYVCTVISVADINAARKFYEELFSLEIYQNYGRNITFSCGLALQQDFDWLVSLPKEKVIKKSNNTKIVFEEQDFDGFLNKLNAYPNIEYLGEVIEHSWGQRVIRFYDLDGHIIEVGEDMKMVIKRFLVSGMTMEEVSVKMDISTEDLSKLLDEKSAKLLKAEKTTLPASLFIGRRYTEQDRENGSFSNKWAEWFQNGLFSPLEALGSLSEHDDAYIGLMRLHNGKFEYWIGMFFPEGTAVPLGYVSVAIPAGDYGICWVYGNEQNGEIYGGEVHLRCLQALQAQGWRYREGDWCFERYNCPRFTSPDEKGNVILDYGFALEREYKDNNLHTTSRTSPEKQSGAW